MIARVLDIPDDDALLPGWLDGQIVGPHVHELVAELAAVHGGSGRLRMSSAKETAVWLGASLPDVLARGTSALPRPRLGELLQNPGLLPGLQELVFVDGGDHWQDLARRENRLPPLPRALDGDGSDIHAPADPDAVAHARPTVPAAKRDWSAALPRLVAALAASVLVAIGVWSLAPRGRAAAPWGWNRPDAFAFAGSPEEYLERLAAAAGEWSAAEPASEPQLAARLGELLTGCDRLLAAPHEPLSPADREWLRERCGVWRGKIAGHLAALDASHDLAAVRKEADATVSKLVTALRTRAEEIRQRNRVAAG